MTRRQLGGWLFGILAYLLFLIATLPASYLSGWLTSRLPDVQLVDVSGTVLSGKAGQLRVQSLPMGSLSWNFDWLALFTASYGYRFDLEDDEHGLQGRVDMRFGRVYVHDLKGHAPVAALDRWLPLPPHSVNGNLSVDIKELDLKSSRPASADGQISLDGATLSWPGSYTLGSFRATLSSASGGGIDARIADNGSPLELRAELALDTEGRYHLSGTLAPHSPGDAASQKLLAYLGSPDATGHYPFDLNGQW